MAQPFLNLGNIGFVFQCIGGCRCTKAMHAKTLHIDLGTSCVGKHGLVDTISRQCCTVFSAYRQEEGRVRHIAMSRYFEIGMNAFGASCMQWKVAQLVPFAMNTKVKYAPSCMNIANLERAKLFASQPVIEQH